VFPKQFRLKKRSEFQGVFLDKRMLREGGLGLKCVTNKTGHVRFGFVVSSKIIPRAVDRNDVKRKLAATARQYQNNLKPGHDILILVLRRDIVYDKEVMDGLVVKILKKANLWREK